MSEFVSAVYFCPHCGTKLNAGWAPFDAEPATEGDLSICIQCSGLLKLGKDMQVSPLPEDEIFDIILEDPAAYAKIITMQKALAAMKAEKKAYRKKKGKRRRSL